MAGTCDGVHAGDISQEESDAGILPSHGITIDVPGTSESGRPPAVHHLYVPEGTPCSHDTNSTSSMPSYQSPLRHHRRAPSSHREVKVRFLLEPCEQAFVTLSLGDTQCPFQLYK